MKKIPLSFFPREIFIRACNQTFAIEYQPKKSSGTFLHQQSNTLIVEGNLHRSNVYKILKQWLVDFSKLHLMPIVESEMIRTGLSCKHVRFKNQKSRWGSCSEHGNINLNIQLLFLPEHLVRQVIVHELCHTTFLNHSKNFWNLVSSFEPNYKTYERELRRGKSSVPKWLYRS